MWKSLDVLGISASLDQLVLPPSPPPVTPHSSTLFQYTSGLTSYFFFQCKVIASSFLSSCGLPTDLGSPAFQTSFLLRYKSQSEK